ncbi:ADP-ribosylglycohydrolase family protein [Sulfurimonas sp. NW9]|uniref:ADP-ribosylglycohydrolase family protein n=1 Tax=Sulfurimonas sp. NW9 TaxID=2922728 RepID=UPI003DA994AA
MYKNKIVGSLIGLAVGDALGAPYEFKKPSYEVSSHFVEGGAHSISIGEWTDDTSMALCLAQSLIENNGFNAKDQMDKYVSWEEDGYFSTRSQCFDIGNTVARALSTYRRTKEPFSGITGDANSGNGSLMRLAPIVLLYYKDINKLIKYASLSSKTTHKSQLAVDACIYYAQLIAGAVKGYSKEKLLSNEFIDIQDIRKEVLNVINGSYKEDKVYKPTGYVIDTLETALMAFYRFNSFEDGLLHVISLGYDTDTVGAVYGQLAGAFYGYKAIPHKWSLLLMKHDMIYDVAINLYQTEVKETKEHQLKDKIHILVGDITSINADVVVNAANYSLLGSGGGVDGAIHKAGGKEILKECEFLRKHDYPDGLPTGEAVITTAGNMKVKYIIHTVGPQYLYDINPSVHLQSCYKKSFLLAERYKCKSIAFPFIATGAYAYPKKKLLQLLIK